MKQLNLMEAVSIAGGECDDIKITVDLSAKPSVSIEGTIGDIKDCFGFGNSPDTSVSGMVTVGDGLEMRGIREGAHDFGPDVGQGEWTVG